MNGGSRDPEHTEEKPVAEVKTASRMAESFSGQVWEQEWWVEQEIKGKSCLKRS